MQETIQAHLYDFPKYYDLVFGSDWQAELRFIDRCLVRYLQVPGKQNWHDLPTARGQKLSLFEPACGTGRLLFRLAKHGNRASGLDLNERAVAFCNKRMRRLGLPESVFVGDMTDFSLPQPVDAAFNTINSFRHLATEDAARSHLECMAQAVRPGGIYILGLHLTPTRGEPTDGEAWSARRGHLQVNTSMRMIERNLRKREERCGMTIDVYTPTKSLRIDDEIVFRTYTRPQLQQLLASVPQWRIAEVFDFSYNLHRTVEIGDATEDIVLILSRT